MKIVKIAILEDESIKETLVNLAVYTNTNMIQVYDEESKHYFVDILVSSCIEDIIKDILRIEDNEECEEWLLANDEFTVEELKLVLSEIEIVEAQGLLSFEFHI